MSLYRWNKKMTTANEEKDADSMNENGVLPLCYLFYKAKEWIARTVNATVASMSRTSTSSDALAE